VKFSIITPTVERESLIQCVESVLAQSFTDWEMLIQVDAKRINEPFFERFSSTRKIWVEECGVCHRNGGNTCRHLAWKRATGDWIFHLDDDNTFASPRTLQQIAKQLENIGDVQWTLWPIFRHGHIFFFDPPEPCYFDTGNAVVRREIAQWPDIPDYASDAVWLQELKKYPYKACPDALPIMVMDKTSFGEGGGINGQ
jgi:glycosyltransferase involved in cell wall biosynthesis